MKLEKCCEVSLVSAFRNLFFKNFYLVADFKINSDSYEEDSVKVFNDFCQVKEVGKVSQVIRVFNDRSGYNISVSLELNDVPLSVSYHNDKDLKDGHADVEKQLELVEFQYEKVDALIDDKFTHKAIKSLLLKIGERLSQMQEDFLNPHIADKSKRNGLVDDSFDTSDVCREIDFSGYELRLNFGTVTIPTRKSISFPVKREKLALKETNEPIEKLTVVISIDQETDELGNLLDTEISVNLLTNIKYLSHINHPRTFDYIDFSRQEFLDAYTDIVILSMINSMDNNLIVSK